MPKSYCENDMKSLSSLTYYLVTNKHPPQSLYIFREFFLSLNLHLIQICKVLSKVQKAKCYVHAHEISEKQENQ